MEPPQKSQVLPSSRWSSFEPWNYGGMKERLEMALAKLHTAVLVDHTEKVLGQPVVLSKPFSAGQYWICFELVADDGRLVIGRARLPRHPDTPSTVTKEDERYAIDCEVATMTYVRQQLSQDIVRVPQVYAYEAAGSPLAAAFGAPYMLLEGFYGNTLQDVAFDICGLSLSNQEHIISQWTRVQAEIATLAFPRIGSISSVTPTGEAVIGRLATAATDGLDSHGPFATAGEYFKAVADASVKKATEEKSLPPDDARPSWATLGALVFQDIVYNTTLYSQDDTDALPLNHMDLGTQNILVDDSFSFVAVIDWEFAQTAPWAVNHFPMPFPLVNSDDEIQRMLNDPSHVAHANVVRQVATRKLYMDSFRAAEKTLQDQGRRLAGSFADVLGSPPSRIYACFTMLGRLPATDEGYVREMVRLAFGGLGDEGTNAYLQSLKSKMFL